MTKANITQYSSTASSNQDIDDININEGCPASGLNNAIRSLMAHLKNVDTGSQALTALTVTGNVTVAGNIQKTSGDFTLDVAGDINLDSDSGYVLFKDGGTEHARIFQNNSGDVNIGSQISDKDMKFNGNDGGSAITALTLDMSDSGRAIFNSRAGINGGTNEGVLTVASSTASMATNGNAHITLQNTNQTTGNKGLINYKATADSGSGFIPLAFGGRVTDATNAGRKGAFCVYVADTDNVDVDNDERLRIHPNGVASFNNGIALGVGTANTASNVLDDYEGGTWTPVYENDGSSGYATQIGTYTKIGQLVTAYFSVVLNNNQIGGNNLRLTGLPFTASNPSGNYGATSGMHMNGWSSSANKPDNGLVPTNSTYIDLYHSQGTTGTNIPTGSNLGTGSLIGFVTYRAV